MLIQKGRTTIICEMSQTYEGSFEVAEKLVSSAIDARADAIKFQIFEADELATADYQHYQLFKKLELSADQWKRLIDQAHQGGILALADVFGEKSVRMLIDLGIDGFKIHPTDVKNAPFLKFLAESGRPLLLSAGGSFDEEIKKAIDILQTNRAGEIVLLHGFQSYPTLVEDTNLNKIRLLQNIFNLPVGFADHIDGDHTMKFDLCALALGMGVQVLEKHITLDRALKMEDHESALDPSVFKEFVNRIRNLEKALGEETFHFSSAEEKYRQGTKKHIVARRNLESGTKITPEDITMKRTNEEYPFQEIEDIMGKTVINSIEKDRVIKLENIKVKVVCVLACRVQSSRLYAKPLQLLSVEENRTILDYMLDHLAVIPQIDETVLAISEGKGNEPFIHVAEKRGLQYVVGDQKDVLGRLIAAGKKTDADIIFRVTSESPFIYMEELEDALTKHIKNNASLTVHEQLPESAYFELINLSDLERAHRDGEDRHRSEFCTLYINENPDKFKIQTLSVSEHLKRPDIRITIDWPEDLIVAREIYKALKREGEFISIKDIIDYLDENPKLHQINNWIDAGGGRIWK